MVKEIKKQLGNIMGGPGGTSGPMPDQTGKHIDHGDPGSDGDTKSSQVKKPLIDKGDPGLDASTPSTRLARPVGPSNPGDPGPDDNKKPTAKDGFRITGSLGAGGGGDPGPDDTTMGVTLKPGGHGGIESTPKKSPSSGGTDVPLKDPKEPNDPPDHPIGGHGDPGDTKVASLGGEVDKMKNQLRAVGAQQLEGE
jgi:hypothetical protein